MTVITQISEDKRQLDIRIDGKFDFSLHQLFRAAYRDRDSGVRQYRLHLSHASYMDSSALGMILLLKEHADHHGSELVLVAPSESVRKILQIANFQQLLRIEG